ncbi:hypothetical protein RYX36_033099, partial [Vicia faba]
TWKFIPCERRLQPDFNLTEKYNIAFSVKFKERVDPIKSCNAITRDFGNPYAKLVFPFGAENRTHIGFGFSAADNVHKVVMMHEVTGWACIMYHMELRKWRSRGEFLGIPCGAMDNPYGKFIKTNFHVKGTLNWLLTNEDNS